MVPEVEIFQQRYLSGKEQSTVRRSWAFSHAFFAFVNVLQANLRCVHCLHSQLLTMLLTRPSQTYISILLMER